MVKKCLFILISLLFFKAGFAEDLDCASNFETRKQLACNSLSNTDQYCLLVDNECREWYRACEDYAPTSDFDDSICQKITPSTINKKCAVNTESGAKKCVTVDQACEDSSDLICTGINLESGKRCVFKGEGQKCEEHSNSCSGLTQTDCAKNIPSDATKKCSWVSSSCTEVNRKCSEFTLFKDSTTNSYETLCKGLESGTSKACILDDNKCIEVYDSCESATTEDDCIKTKPLTSDLLGYDTSKKCEWSGTACSTESRKCSDYKTGEDTEEICAILTSETTGKICSFNSEKNVCEEIYQDCDSYNSAKASFERNADECGAIDAGSSNFKCKLTDGSCQKTAITCEDFTEEESCFKYQPSGSIYKCIFKGGKCIQEAKRCRNFDYEVTDDSDTKKNNCGSIISIEENSDGKKFFGKCEYNPIAIPICDFEYSYYTCDDYQGENEYICGLYYGGKYAKCVMKNKKCTAEQIAISTCDEYNDLISYEDKTKEGCESIVSTNIYEYCVFNDVTKRCYSEKLLCSNYTGNDEKICRLFVGSSSSKDCGIKDGKCVEIDSYIYTSCTSYKGKDKEVCEGIQLKSGGLYDVTRKCVFNEGFCFEEKKECSDATDEIECSKLLPTDITNQICIFKDNACVEQYNSCEAYQNSDVAKDKTTCESIIDEDDYKTKCQFNEGSKTCTKVSRKCSDFKVDSIASLCSATTLSIY